MVTLHRAGHFEVPAVCSLPLYRAVGILWPRCILRPVYRTNQPKSSLPFGALVASAAVQTAARMDARKCQLQRQLAAKLHYLAFGQRRQWSNELHIAASCPIEDCRKRIEKFGIRQELSVN